MQAKIIKDDSVVQNTLDVPAIKGNRDVYLPPAILFLLIVVASIVIGIYTFSVNFGQYIGSIEMTSQSMNESVMSVNYNPILTDSANWDELSLSNREGIARYAVNESITQAETNNVTIFTVTGLLSDRSKPIFLYAGGESLALYVDGEWISILLDG